MADAVRTVAAVEELAISSVPLLGFDSSAVCPGLVALLWLRRRELGDHAMRPCGDWFVVVRCITYYNLGISHSPYIFVLFHLKYP